MASFSCRYKSVAEIEGLDFLECLEILEENGLPYDGTEEVEDLRKIIIDLLPKPETEKDSDTESSLGKDSDSERKSEVKEGTGATTNIGSEEHVESDTKAESKVQTGAGTYTESSEQVNSDTKAESKVQTGAGKYIESSEQVNSDTKAESKVQIGAGKYTESSEQVNSDTKAESKVQIDAGKYTESSEHVDSDTKAESKVQTGAGKCTESSEHVDSDTKAESKVQTGAGKYTESSEHVDSDTKAESIKERTGAEKYTESSEHCIGSDQKAECEENTLSEIERKSEEHSEPELVDDLDLSSEAESEGYTISEMESSSEKESESEMNDAPEMEVNTSHFLLSNITGYGMKGDLEKDIFSEMETASGTSKEPVTVEKSSKIWENRHSYNAKEERMPRHLVQTVLDDPVTRRPSQPENSPESSESDVPPGYGQWKGRIVKNFKKFKKESRFPYPKQMEAEDLRVQEIETFDTPLMEHVADKAQAGSSVPGSKMFGVPLEEFVDRVPADSTVQETKTFGVPLIGLVNRVQAGSNVRETKTFGVPLEKLLDRAPPGSTVPVFVSKVLNYIMSRENTGQMFISKGQRNVVEKLRSSLDTYGDAELDENTDILAVGQLLMEFLQELPNPVFPAEVIPDLETPLDHDDEIGGGYNVAVALLVLPQSHWHLLKFLAQYIPNTVRPGQSLKVIAEAIVPTLTRLQDSGGTQNDAYLKILTRVLVSCFLNTDTIFKVDIETTRKALKEAERAQMGAQIEHMAFKRGRFRRPKSTTSSKPVPGPAGGSTSTKHTKGGSNLRPTIIGEDDVMELQKFLKEGSKADFKRLIETPEYSLPKKKPADLPKKKPAHSSEDVIIIDDQKKYVHSDKKKPVHLPKKKPVHSSEDVIVIGDQKKYVHSDNEEESLEFSDGSSVCSTSPDESMEVCSPTVVESENQKQDTKEFLCSPSIIDLTKSSAPLEPVSTRGRSSRDKGDNPELESDVIILPPDDIEITGVEPAPTSNPSSASSIVSDSSSGNFSAMVSKPTGKFSSMISRQHDLVTTVTSDDALADKVDPGFVSEVMDEPCSKKCEVVSGVGDVGEIDAGTKDEALCVLKGIADTTKYIHDPAVAQSKVVVSDNDQKFVTESPRTGHSGHDSLSEQVGSQDKKRENVIESDDSTEMVTQTVGDPDVKHPGLSHEAGPSSLWKVTGSVHEAGPSSLQKDPGSVHEAGPSSLQKDPGSVHETGPSSLQKDPGLVHGAGPSSLQKDPGSSHRAGPSSLQRDERDRATSSGEHTNPERPKQDGKKDADENLDPKGTERMKTAEFLELMNTPKRWELVKSFLDPTEIYDQLCAMNVVTEKEYFKIFHRIKTKDDRIEYFRQTIIDQKNDIRYIDAVTSFIEQTRITLYMRKILHADDENLKKMQEKQTPKDLKNRRMVHIPTKFRKDQLKKTSPALKPAGETRSLEDFVKDDFDVPNFTEAVQEGKEMYLEAFKTFFQNRAFVQLPVNPLLIVAARGSAKAVDYIQEWCSASVNWNKPLDIVPGVMEGILCEINTREATPLYVATFLEKQTTVKSLIKYSDEKNLVFCMNKLPLSHSMEDVYMTEIGERLKTEYSHLKPAVVPGHLKQTDDTWTRVFVVYSVDVIQQTNHIKEGIGEVMLRNPYRVDPEAKYVIYNQDVREISKDDMERTKRAIETHGHTLWCNHSNLNIISVCSVKSKCKGEIVENNVCVVLYCSTKGVVPLGEKEFPTKLSTGEGDDIDTDVREGYFEFGGYDTRPSTHPHKTLKMGCNIGAMTPRIQNGGGTLGPFVRYNGNLSFLTCAHVLFDVSQLKRVDFTDNVFNRLNVVQPALGSSSSSSSVVECGYVQRAIFNTNLHPGVDVAVVTISDATRQPIKGRFANDHSYRYIQSGFDELPEYNNGSIVYDMKEFATSNMVVKFGSETHLTKGHMEVEGAQARPLSTCLGLPSSQEVFYMSNQYEVYGLKSSVNFFQPGDSGSAVFMLQGTSLHCIGMAIGHTSHGSAVVTPIGRILSALKDPNAFGDTPHCCMANFEESQQQRTARTIKRKYKKMDMTGLRLKSIKKK